MTIRGLIALACMAVAVSASTALAQDMEVKGKTCFDGERYWHVGPNDPCPIARPRQEAPAYVAPPQTDWRAVLEDLKTKRRYQAAQRYKTNMQALQREGREQLLQRAGPTSALSVAAQIDAIPLVGLNGEPLVLRRYVQSWSGVPQSGERVVLQLQAGEPLHRMSAFESLVCAASIARAAAVRRVDIEEKGYLVKQASNVLDGARPGVVCDSPGGLSGRFSRSEPSPAIAEAIRAVAAKTERLLTLNRVIDAQQGRLKEVDRALKEARTPIPEPEAVVDPQFEPQRPEQQAMPVEAGIAPEAERDSKDARPDREAMKQSLMEMALAAKRKAEAAEARVAALENEKRQLENELVQQQSESAELEREINDLEAILLNPAANAPGQAGQ